MTPPRLILSLKLRAVYYIKYRWNTPIYDRIITIGKYMSLQWRRCKSLVILIIINVFISSRTNIFILPWAIKNVHRWRINIVRIYSRIFFHFLTEKKWYILPIKNYQWSVYVYTDTYIYYNLLYNIILSIIYYMNIYIILL